jgi:RNA polymerase sigma-70 factor (sigma-E family)
MIEFEEFVISRAAALLRLAVLLSGDTYLAEDLLQTVLTRSYQRWEQIKAADQPEAYVKRMLVNEHLSWRRRRASRELPIATAPPETATVTDYADGHADRDVVWAMLARLPRRQRAVLVLRYYEDLADEQIAVLLGCSPATVRSNAKRALDALRAAVPALEREALQ